MEQLSFKEPPVQVEDTLSAEKETKQASNHLSKTLVEMRKVCAQGLAAEGRAEKYRELWEK